MHYQWSFSIAMFNNQRVAPTFAFQWTVSIPWLQMLTSFRSSVGDARTRCPSYGNFTHWNIGVCFPTKANHSHHFPPLAGFCWEDGGLLLGKWHHFPIIFMGKLSFPNIFPWKIAIFQTFSWNKCNFHVILQFIFLVSKIIYCRPGMQSCSRCLSFVV